MENIQLTQPTEFSKENEKEHVPDDPDPELSSSDLSSKKNKHNKKKNVVSAGTMTHQTHHRATIMIRPMTVITDASDSKIRAT